MAETVLAYWYYAHELPFRSSVTVGIVAGVIAAIAGFRYVMKGPRAGANVGIAVLYMGILFLGGPIAAVLTGVHLYQFLAHGPIRLGLIFLGEYLAFRFWLKYILKR